MEYAQSDRPDNGTWTSEGKRHASSSERVRREREVGDLVGKNAPSKERVKIISSHLMPEATIWQRPENTMNTIANPTFEEFKNSPTPSAEKNLVEANSEALRRAVHDAYEAIENPPVPDRTSDSDPIVPAASRDTTWVDAFANAPVTHHAFAEAARDTADDDKASRRPYFWTEPKGESSVVHDALPPVVPTLSKRMHEPLVHAVNPNSIDTASPVQEASKREIDALPPDPWQRLTHTVDALTNQDRKTEVPVAPSVIPEKAPIESVERGTNVHESQPAAGISEIASRPEAALPKPATETDNKRVASEVAKTITIDGATVYDMLMGKQIDEEGLQRIVAEYVRGGDIRRAVLQEVARQQIKFERDPQLRRNPLAASIDVFTTQTQEDHQSEVPMATPNIPRPIDTTEHMAKITDGTTDRVQAFLSGRQAGRLGSIVAIVAIYTAIILVIIS